METTKDTNPQATNKGAEMKVTFKVKRHFPSTEPRYCIHIQGHHGRPLGIVKTRFNGSKRTFANPDTAARVASELTFDALNKRQQIEVTLAARRTI